MVALVKQAPKHHAAGPDIAVKPVWANSQNSNYIA